MNDEVPEHTYNIFIFVAFIIWFTSVGITVFHNELECTSKCARHYSTCSLPSSHSLTTWYLLFIYSAINNM